MDVNEPADRHGQYVSLPTRLVSIRSFLVNSVTLKHPGPSEETTSDGAEGGCRC